MHRKLIPIAAVVLTLAGIVGQAQADVLFSTRGSGINQADVDNFVIFDSVPPFDGPVLEDGTFAGSGPFSLTSLRLGYFNNSPTATNVDALVSFYDVVNYNAPVGSPVATGQVGSTYRLHFDAVPGVDFEHPVIYGETGQLSLGAPLAFPDSTFGVIVRFVETNTNVTSSQVSAIWHNVPLTVGSSNNLFAADFNGDGSILVGTNPNNEVGTWESGAPDFFPAANLYIELTGTVPEPGAFALLGLGGLAALRRRRV